MKYVPFKKISHAARVQHGWSEEKTTI